MSGPVAAEVLAQLRALDTPTVCNALEVVAPDRRGHGYSTKPFFAPRPELGSIVGYARTGKICAQTPPTADASIRDLPDSAVGFQLLAGMPGPSHAWVRVEEFNVPVEVHGMRVEPGDLIHADQHGAVVIPIDAAAQVPQAAADIAAREAVLINASRQPGFSAATLYELAGVQPD